MNTHEVLKELISINSYSINKSGVDRKNCYIWDQLCDLPLKRTLHKSKMYGDLMHLQSNDYSPNSKTITLVLHSDTVHKEDESSPILMSGNKLYGPGAIDMQASIFVVIELLKKLSENDQLVNINIIFNTAEEKGSPEFQEVFKTISKESNYIFVYEPSDPGRYNPDEEIFKTQFELVTSRKGIFQQKIVTIGPGGHSGSLATKAERKNAIEQAICMMKEIQDLANYDKGTTVNLAYINGGRENTVIAEKCEFTFDVRFTYQEERERVKEEITKILKTEFVSGVEVEDLGYSYDLPPLEPNRNSAKLLSIAQEVGKDLGMEIIGNGRGGWSDACNMYIYNPNAMIIDGLGPKGDGEHTNNEFVYLDTIEPAIRLSEEIVKRIRYS
jgi:glutamate carboxypeptidase